MVEPTGVPANGETGAAVVWEVIDDGQTPSYVVIDDGQVPDWEAIATADPVSWEVSDTTQTPSYPNAPWGNKVQPSGTSATMALNSVDVRTEHFLPATGVSASGLINSVTVNV